MKSYRFMGHDGLSPYRPEANERGIALILALLTLLCLSTLGAGIILLTQTETWTTTNYKMTTQARYASESGLQQTLNWLTYNYSPSPTGLDLAKSPVEYPVGSGSPVVLSAMSGVTANYPTASVQTAFNAALQDQPVSGMGVPANYSVHATLLQMRMVRGIDGSSVPVQTWHVVSRGRLNSSDRAAAKVELSADLQTPTGPVFQYAAFGDAPVCASVHSGGNGTTDSYDSSVGPYSVSQSNTDGNLGSNGNIWVEGTSTHLHGSVQTPLSDSPGACNAGSPDAVSINGSPTIDGGLVPLPSPLIFPTPPPPSPLPPTTSYAVQGGNPCGTGPSALPLCGTIGPAGPSAEVTFAPGLYGNITVNNKVVHLTAGTYTFNQLLLAGGAEIIVDSGPVVLQLAGQSLTGTPPVVLDMAGGSFVSNPTGNAANFYIAYGGTAEVHMRGSSDAYGVVYAPNSNVTVYGSSHWYGSILGNTVDVSGGVNLHYDRNLSSEFYITGALRASAFSWNKF
jgi:Tfp pilus assembly protein PilX